MKEEEIRNYYSFFCEAWKYFKKYAEKEMTENFWVDMVAKGEEIQRKYGGTEFHKRIISQIILEMERRR